MRTRLLHGLLLGALMMVASGCRQPVGEMPVPTGEQPNKLEDLGRDLQNIGGRAAGAEQDLTDDLDGLDSEERPASGVRALARSLNEALSGRDVSGEHATAIAQLLFAATTLNELNPRQIETLGADISRAVQATGAAEGPARRVGDAAVALARVMSRNPRRWYHLF